MAEQYPPPESNGFYNFMRALIVAATKLYFRLEVYGAENTPKTGGVLLVANHASNLDPTTIACRLPRQTDFLAKEELFVGPLGWLLRRTNSHKLARSGIDKNALRTCIELIRQGHMLMVFPEGSRTEDGNLLEPRPGAAMIAMQSDATILPAYIDGSLQAMRRGALFPRPKKLRVFVGKPFRWDEGLDKSLPRREQYDVIGKNMMSHIADLQDDAKKLHQRDIARLRQ